MNVDGVVEGERSFTLAQISIANATAHFAEIIPVQHTGRTAFADENQVPEMRQRTGTRLPRFAGDQFRAQTIHEGNVVGTAEPLDEQKRPRLGLA
jgi:hypothetical protein